VTYAVPIVKMPTKGIRVQISIFRFRISRIGRIRVAVLSTISMLTGDIVRVGPGAVDGLAYENFRKGASDTVTDVKYD
jgi:hypothetical protein